MIFATITVIEQIKYASSLCVIPSTLQDVNITTSHDQKKALTTYRP